MRQYFKECEAVIASLKSGSKKKLLLHACCAPCASAVLEYLAPHFDVTVYFFNPNIYPKEEYERRLLELKRYISLRYPGIILAEGSADESEFLNVVRGFEAAPEGGERCGKCFELRLRATASFAMVNRFDYFATTLTLSPHKNAELVNSIGERISGETGVKYLASDFKKRDGYKRSLELSAEYGLYRQDYCGCKFSIKPTL